MPLYERGYNEDTTEIMGKMPSWLIRWGLSVIFTILIGFVAASYFVRFPQIVTAPITITTINPPADLIAKTSGRIDTILVENGDKVDRNQTIAMLHNSAKYIDVITVRDSVESYNIRFKPKWIDKEYEVGELQSSFSEFKQLYYDYQNYLDIDNIDTKIELLIAQVSKYIQYIQQLKEQEMILAEDYSIAKTSFDRDSLLYNKKTISTYEYEQSRQAILIKANNIKGFKASIINSEIQLLQMRQQIEELKMQKNMDIISYRNQINESRSRLLAQIESWSQNYLLISPTKGELSYSRYWSSNQNINASEKLGTIIPYDTSRTIGIMEVPSTGLGKVRNGQTVNVKLNSYPYLEFGVIKGEIIRISAVPDEDVYFVEVIFPNGLQSSYKKHLELILQMDGVGEIVTRNERLIYRFINPLRSFFDKINN